jgi:hypothetical protein
MTMSALGLTRGLVDLVSCSDRMLDARVVRPSDEFFPDKYDKGDAGVRLLYRRVCKYMKVDPERVDLEIIPDVSELMELLPEYRFSSTDPAGLHYGESGEQRALIGVKQSLLKDPISVIATLAHELGHVILLDDGHMRREVDDMEPMTDLVTVFLGMGIFTANSARRFVQYQDDRRQGWSMSRQGYLTEAMFAYALAWFARKRGEGQPNWTGDLTINVKSYFRKSAAWLEKDLRQIR